MEKKLLYTLMPFRIQRWFSVNQRWIFKNQCWIFKNQCWIFKTQCWIYEEPFHGTRACVHGAVHACLLHRTRPTALHTDGHTQHSSRGHQPTPPPPGSYEVYLGTRDCSTRTYLRAGARTFDQPVARVSPARDRVEAAPLGLEAARILVTPATLGAAHTHLAFEKRGTSPLANAPVQ